MTHWEMLAVRTSPSGSLPLSAVCSDGVWCVVIRLVLGHGGPQLEQLHVLPAGASEAEVARLGALVEPAAQEPAGQPAMTARDLRALPLGRLAEAALRQAMEGEGSQASVSAEKPEPPLRYGDLSIPMPLVRTAQGDSALSCTVALYLNAVGEGASAPAAAVAAALGLTTNTVHSRLARARARGILVSLGPGRRGGWLTPPGYDDLHELAEGRHG